MTGYIVRRIAFAGVTFLIATSMAFVIMNVIPGDVAHRALGDFATPERLEALRAELGFDRPLVVRYLDWLAGIFTLDFGHSYFNTEQSVLAELQRKAVPTFELAILAMLFAMLIGLPAGLISAIRPGTWVDYIVRPASIMGLALPSFWIGLLVLLLPSFWWNYAPPRYVALTESPLQNLQLMVPAAFVLGLAAAASASRLTRATMLEVVREDYVRTAWAKGLRERVVISRHALRNALLPVLTLMSLQLAALLGGTVIIENIFAIPGMGTMAITAINSRDYALVQGFVVVMVFVYVGINLLVDLTTMVIDPRIRLA